jgi:hypothetical protein
MQNKSISRSSTSFLSRFQWKHVLELAVPLAFFMLLFFFFPFLERFKLDPDEGFNAIKGLLLVRGYPLYSEIWSDQPPFFTYLIAATIRIFGHDINALRTLVLLLSTTLLTSAYLFLRLTWGTWHALAGAILIFLLPFYTMLSVSVMIGLPAIAFAGLSLLALTLWHQHHSNLWLVLSATALSLSILTKLFTAFLAPIFLVGILIDQKYRSGQSLTWHKLFKPAIIWSGVFAFVIIGLGLIMVGPANIDQLLDTHLIARDTEQYLSYAETHTINWYLRDSWAILLLALLCTLFTLQRRNWLSLYLVVWITGAYLLLSIQIPVWHHHQLLITIPAAMLAGIAVGEALHLISNLFHTRKLLSRQTLLITVTIICFILALIGLIPQIYTDFTTPVYLLERERIFLVKMNNHAPETQWFVTDVPMYAFRVGIPVPPPLSVISDKRLATGNLTETQIIDMINKYKPEQIFLGRFEFPELKSFLQDDYKILYTRGKRTLYLRKD